MNKTTPAEEEKVKIAEEIKLNVTTVGMDLLNNCQTTSSGADL